LTPEGSQAEGTLLSLSASSRRIDDDVRPLIVFSSGRWIPVPSNVGEARTRSLQPAAGNKLPAGRADGG